MKTYWVAECTINSQILYWTGNSPSYYEEDEILIWTPDIHKAQKFESEKEAKESFELFNLYGEVKEHMDL